MPRRRLAVALLCPPALAERVDVLRRSLGVASPFHVPPHLTLVPPLNVRAEDLPQVDRLLRDAATAVSPFELEVGPVATFAPASPTIHLAVGGDDGALGSLTGLRRRLRVGPLERPDVWPFVPHVTLVESAPDDALAAGLAALPGVGERWPVTDVHLLAEHAEDGRRRWVPEREEPLGGPAVVGRGGPEVVLRVAGMVERAAAELLGAAPVEPGPGPLGRSPLSVVAEDAGSPGVPVGVAAGSVGGGLAILDGVSVAPDRRGEGRGAHLLARFCTEATWRGAQLVLADGTAGVPLPFLVRHGFSAVGDVVVRRLADAGRPAGRMPGGSVGGATGGTVDGAIGG